MKKLNMKQIAGGAIVLAVLGLVLTVTMSPKEDKAVESDQPELIVGRKSKYLLLNNAENSLENEANAVMNNLNISINGDQIEFDSNTISGNTAHFIDNDTNTELSVFNLLSKDAERPFTVSNVSINQSKSGSMIVRYTDEYDAELEEQAGNTEDSQKDHKGHYIKEPAHASQQRYAEGVVDNFVINGVADEAISGTIEGEKVIENDPYLERDEDGSIDKNSELEQQEVTIVDKPVAPTPEPEVPSIPEQTIQPEEIVVPSEPTVEEGYTEPEIDEPLPEVEESITPEYEVPVTPETELPTLPEPEIEAESNVTTDYGQLVVINDAQEAVGTYWGNGTERVVATVSEANVIDNGDGTVTTAFGIFNK